MVVRFISLNDKALKNERLKKFSLTHRKFRIRKAEPCALHLLDIFSVTFTSRETLLLHCYLFIPFFYSTFVLIHPN